MSSAGIDVPALLQDYISAGFDPTSFWSLTPRLYVLHMKGATRRVALEKARLAEAVWVGMRADQKELRRFISQSSGEDATLSPEALVGVIRAASIGLPVITMNEYLKGKRTND